MLKKGLKREILIFLAEAIDELNAWSFKNQIRRLMFDGWYKRSSFGPTVSRLLSVGDIEKIEKKGEVFYRLTSRGWGRLKENIPVMGFSKQAWDGRWRIVIFDIQEKKKALREALRHKLLSLGFGRWQRSVYISPHDIKQEINQYLEAQGLFPFSVCLVARRADLGNDRELAEKVWRLDELNEEYRELVEKCQRLAEEKKKGKIRSREMGKIWRLYQDLILKDPCLPEGLLPNDWLARKARKEFRQLCQNFSDRSIK